MDEKRASLVALTSPAGQAAVVAGDIGGVLAERNQLHVPRSVAVSRDVLAQPSLDGSGRVRDQLLDTAAVLARQPYEPGQRFAGTVRRVLTAA